MANIPNELRGKCNLCIEIGSNKGSSAKSIVRSGLNSEGKLICVDPLTDQYLNDNLTPEDIKGNEGKWKRFKGQYDGFMSATKKERESNKIELIRKMSKDAYPDLLKKYEGQVDYIYVDGDHREESVYLDAVNCFKLCRSGGYMLFDDYGNNWGSGCCKRGIDRFLEEHKGSYEIVTKSTQLLLKKEMQDESSI